jgi:hypothetical protein
MEHHPSILVDEKVGSSIPKDPTTSVDVTG